MAILDGLLGRLGYVRLNEFGLVRTPEGRVAMLHRRVLDDGAGGRIVGWRAEDPAPTVLEPMDMVPRTAVRAVEAARSSISMASHQVPAAVVAAAMATKPARAPSPKPASEDDDEWEWQMAMARARAAADEAEKAAKARMVKPVAAKPAAKPAAASVDKDLPQLVGVSKSAPVLAVAKLTPSRTPPPVPAKQTGPVAKIALVPEPVPAPSAPVPIERARMARGSAPPSSRQQPVVRAERASESSRSLPLPPPEETARTKAVPPAVPARPAAMAAAAAARKPVASLFDGEITETDARPAQLPRFSARFR